MDRLSQGRGGRRAAAALIADIQSFQPTSDLRSGWNGLARLREGIVKLKLTRSGVWQIHVVHSHAPAVELAGKADKVEYKASLTFETP
jgi:hypothetical protein